MRSPLIIWLTAVAAIGCRAKQGRVAAPAPPQHGEKNQRELFALAVAAHGVHLGKEVPKDIREKSKGNRAVLYGCFSEMHSQIADELDRLLDRYPHAPAEERKTVRQLAQNNRRQAQLFQAVHARNVVGMKATAEKAQLLELNSEMAELLKKYQTPMSELIDGALGTQPPDGSDAAKSSEGEGRESE